jgi:chromosomal replication initiator protein
MQFTAAGLWEQVLKAIATQVDTQVFETWFRPTKGVTFSQSGLVVETPNLFFSEWLKERYLDLANRALKATANRDMAVEFSVSRDSQPARIPSEAMPSTPPSPARFDEDANPLNPRYTFANFVVGNSNHFCHAASLAVSQHPAKTYNPLFIYGGVGLGKTHVMQAIGHYVRENHPPKKVCYVSAETFMNEMIYAIQNAKTLEFRTRYRGVDVLLIDDIQFLAGKESTQEEFFHTFNSLYDAHKQIVVTSDRPPKEIAALEERLVSRFEWGLVTDIQAPDLETRIAILRKKAEIDGLSIPNDVLLLIADCTTSSIRELEGSLIKLLAYSSLTGREITVETAREVLKDFLNKTPRIVTIDQIQKMVAEYFDIPTEAMKARKRTNSLAHPRQVAMYLCRQLTDVSLSEIGTRFGGRDHTTVMHACDRIEKRLDAEPDLQATIARLRSRLQSAAPSPFPS